MKKLSSLILLASSAFLFACSSSDPGNDSNTTNTPSDAAPVNEVGSTSPAEPVSTPSMDNSDAMTMPPAPAPTSTQATSTAPGMNPPHGEPGHRCDIAVGAPLSSPPATPSAPALPPAVPSSPAIAPAPPSSSSTTASGINPPHGEPGHRCDIAVGAPLPN